MTITMERTRAEEALLEHFAAAADRLPGGEAMRALRAEAMARFAGLGLPHRRIEEWKYTDLRSRLRQVYPPADSRRAASAGADGIEAALGPFAAVPARRFVFLDGLFRPDLSAPCGSRGAEDEPFGLTFLPMDRLLDADGETLRSFAGFEDGEGAAAVLALNTAFLNGGAGIAVAAGASLARPLLLVFVRSISEPSSAAIRTAVAIGAGARATLIEVHVPLAAASAPFQENAVTTLHVGREADFTHLKFVAGDAAFVHLSAWLVHVAADARYRAFQFTRDAGLARNQIFLSFEGEGANADIAGLLLGRGTSHGDTTALLRHGVPGCTSRTLMKAVLDGEARGVFQGKIVVSPGAEKTDGRQTAHGLLLSPDAEFDSKPELEIFADDVACGHGSTTADLDEDLLFYCRSRGLPLSGARALLTLSFAGEALDKIGDEAVRAAFLAGTRAWLNPPSE